MYKVNGYFLYKSPAYLQISKDDITLRMPFNNDLTVTYADDARGGKFETDCFILTASYNDENAENNNLPTNHAQIELNYKRPEDPEHPENSDFPMLVCMLNGVPKEVVDVLIQIGKDAPVDPKYKYTIPANNGQSGGRKSRKSRKNRKSIKSKNSRRNSKRRNTRR